MNVITEISLKPELDGYIEDTPNVSFSDPEIWVRGIGGPSALSLILFNLNEIPPGAKIVEAELRLFATALAVTDPATLRFNVIKDPWDESSIDWPTASSADFVYDKPSPVIDIVMADANKTISLRIDNIVQDWVYGAQNAGIRLSDISSIPGDVRFSSSEGSDPPELFIRYF